MSLTAPHAQRRIDSGIDGGALDRLRAFMAPPAESIGQYLIEGEEVLHIDAPAFNAFFVDELPIIVLTAAAASAAIVWGSRSGNLFVAGVAMIACGVLLLYLRAKRWSERYTAYVLTTARVMRISGFLSRSAAWIPWVKVTDVRYEASFAGRLLGYATIHIDSANETSGLSEMKNLRDPHTFYVTLTELVQQKQGSLRSRSALLHE
jgi:hypothetical protein